MTVDVGTAFRGRRTGRIDSSWPVRYYFPCRRWRKHSSAVSTPPPFSDPLPVRPCSDGGLISEAAASEYRVFKIIEDDVAIFGRDHRVFAQTCLGEILKSSDQNAFHSINSKRADILVIDGGGWPVLAVEYQGDGHYQSAVAARDAVKKEALRKAGVRHLEVYPADNDDKIRSRVRGQLGWKATPSTHAGESRSHPAVRHYEHSLAPHKAE